jgi:hypothetical protein
MYHELVKHELEKRDKRAQPSKQKEKKKKRQI